MSFVLQGLCVLLSNLGDSSRYARHWGSGCEGGVVRGRGVGCVWDRMGWGVYVYVCLRLTVGHHVGGRLPAAPPLAAEQVCPSESARQCRYRHQQQPDQSPLHTATRQP